MPQPSVDGNYQILKIILSRIGGGGSCAPSGSATEDIIFYILYTVYSERF